MGHQSNHNSFNEAASKHNIQSKMKAFIVLVAVACATAHPGVVLNGLTLGAPTVLSAPTLLSAPTVLSAPVVSHAIVAPAVTKTQYHSQDELGQASYGHAHAGQAHAAVRDAFGNVAGSYAYINPEGKEVRVEYIADGAGFRVASNALPVAPSVPEAPKLEAPAPVQDTPEVAAAKAAHSKAIEEARARNAEADKADAAKPAEADKPQSRRKRGVISAVAPVALAAPSVIAAAPVAVVAAPAVREATLTKIVNTPGHAISYRVN